LSEPDPVWVLDTSALIEAKLALPVSDQWAAFKRLEELVVEGRIAMPRHVIKEVSEIAHPDLPGAWAPGVRRHLVHPLEPDWEHLAEVMRVAGDVVDPNKTEEDADPYVLALALHLRAAGLLVIVVTEESIDRIRIAMTTACARLHLRSCDVRAFLGQLGIATRPRPEPRDSNEERGTL
jgi:rRNA maturation endonuclease Nob1